MKWQPIATGPKDGLLTVLLVPSRKRHVLLTGYWDRTRWLGLNHDCAVAEVEPTHWMELPPPPSIEQGEPNP